MRKMGKKQEILLVMVCAIMTWFMHSNLILAEDYSVSGNVSDKSEERPKVNFRSVERVQFVQNIKEEMMASQKDLSDLKAHIKDTTGRLTDVHESISTLSDQLANIDYQIYNTENLILNVATQISEREREIVLVYNEIEVKNIEISHQKNMLSDYLLTLYEQESAVTNTLNNNKEINIAKLLLSDDSVGDQLQIIRYFEILEATGHDIFNKLEKLVNELEADRAYFEKQKNSLEELNARLEIEKSNLNIQREAKKGLIKQTRGEEAVYQKLLSESKKQQAQIQDDIKILKDNLDFIENEMLILGSKFDANDYRGMFSGEIASIYAYINATRDENISFYPRWPIKPERGISAYFRDPSYLKVFGVGHNAIDIPALQKSLIHAPAEGIVYKVRDNGKGYSYLILAHRSGYMTVYGHVYEFLVEPGEVVTTGQVIALSGGMPGSKGAGFMTTGSHLHFEVMKGGSYLDPMEFLPLSELPYATLPRKYQLMADNQARQAAKKVRRAVSVGR